MTTPIIMLVLMMAPYQTVRLVSAATRRGFDGRLTRIVEVLPD